MSDLANDLFGNPVVTTETLRDKYIEPPFSVLNTQSAHWQKRKQKWLNLGIQSELGREGIKKAANFRQSAENCKGHDKYGNKIMTSTSLFDPVLCELAYTWFKPQDRDTMNILDPFAGGSVRGIVASELGYNYVGIDISERQVLANRQQAIDLVPSDRLAKPVWLAGDSNKVLDTLDMQFDLLFTCPPYADLEVYSDDPADISNMPYAQFIDTFGSIISKACNRLRAGSFACIVVGEARDKKGFYYGFVPDTVKIFQACGMMYYNEAVILTSLMSATLRANGYMRTQKLVKVHQNMLVFKKNGGGQQ